MALPPQGAVHRFPHQAMGTFYEVLISGCDEVYARQAAQAAFREVDHLESLFSRFNPSSEIGQINRLDPGSVLKIGWETYECLAAAERVRIDTGGAFNINFRAEKAERDRGVRRARRNRRGFPPRVRGLSRDRRVRRPHQQAAVRAPRARRRPRPRGDRQRLRARPGGGRPGRLERGQLPDPRGDEHGTRRGAAGGEDPG